jgi:hypothetical protein
VVVTLAMLMIGWSALLARAGNVNYATFKLGGWLGPGLFGLGAALAPSWPTWSARALMSIVLGLATVRALGMAAEMYSVWPLYARPSGSQAGWHIETDDQGCTLVVDSTDRRVLQTAVAGSAAPTQGCKFLIR